MKRRLNLFDQRKASRKTVSYVQLTRKISFFLFIGLLFINLGLGGGYVYFRYQGQQIEKKINRATQYIEANKDFAEQIQRFVFKISVLKTYLATDAQSYIYYAKLIELLNGTSIRGNLSSFTINNIQETTFTIDFGSYEDAISFIEALEGPDFQEAFVSLTLDGFSASDLNTSAYSLNLRGTFVAIPTYGS